MSILGLKKKTNNYFSRWILVGGLTSKSKMASPFPFAFQKAFECKHSTLFSCKKPIVSDWHFLVVGTLRISNLFPDYYRIIFTHDFLFEELIKSSNEWIWLWGTWSRNLFLKDIVLFSKTYYLLYEGTIQVVSLNSSTEDANTKKCPWNQLCNR